MACLPDCDCNTHTTSEYYHRNWKEEKVCVNGTTVRRFLEYTVSPPFPTGRAVFYSVEGAKLPNYDNAVLGACTEANGTIDVGNPLTNFTQTFLLSTV